MARDIVSRQVYYKIFATLLALTFVTVVAAFIDLGPLNTPVALIIATVKAMLVILFFMHVRHSSPIIWVAVAAGVFWIGILLTLTFGDYLTRGWLPVPGW